MTMLDKYSPAWLRFALFCTLFMLAAIWMEVQLAPLCRITASQVGALLGLTELSPHVQGDLITIPGFSVKIVTECTPLYACLLYCALVLAQPSNWIRTLVGLLLGVMIISTANLLRISFIISVGPLVSSLVFDILHVYLGQIAMLVLVLTAALAWMRWSAGGTFQLPFLIWVTVCATFLFVPWVLVNKVYVALLDRFVAVIFSLLYPDYQLLTPRPFAVYNHTFAVPLFLALIIAGDRDWTYRRVAATIGGVFAIAVCHTLFRISHVIWTALDVPEIVPLHQVIYLLGQFLLPFLLWIWLERLWERR